MVHLTVFSASLVSMETNRLNTDPECLSFFFLPTCSHFHNGRASDCISPVLFHSQLCYGVALYILTLIIKTTGFVEETRMGHNA